MCRVVPANAAEGADLVDADLVDMVRDKSGMCMAAELCVCSTGAVCSKLPRSDAPDWDSDSSSLSSLAGRIMSWRQPGSRRCHHSCIGCLVWQPLGWSPPRAWRLSRLHCEACPLRLNSKLLHANASLPP